MADAVSSVLVDLNLSQVTMVTDFSAAAKNHGHMRVSSQSIDNIQSINLGPLSGMSFKDDLYSRLEIDFYKVCCAEGLA